MDEKYTNFWKDGVYRCGTCGQELFDSDTKFKSGTQWPSFRAARAGAITTKPDYSHNMVRTEVLCSKCGTHLGHVFDDGRVVGDEHPDAGKRFCILSDSLNFDEQDKKA